MMSLQYKIDKVGPPLVTNLNYTLINTKLSSFHKLSFVLVEKITYVNCMFDIVPRGNLQKPNIRKWNLPDVNE